jgi:hypothetical protein
MRYLLLSLAAMGSCLLAAAPRAYTEASRAEARLVVGGDCVGLGVRVTVCSCNCPGLCTGQNIGVSPAGAGSFHTNPIGCLCDTTAPKVNSTGGTCTGG